MARIVRVHRHGDIAQQGLRARGRHHDALVRALDRVGDVPERTLLLDRVDLEVGDRRVQLGVPVDQPRPAVDQPVAVEPHEHLDDGARDRLVHGEALGAPVQRGAQAAQLPGDGIAGFTLPVPDALDKGVAPDIAPAAALPLQQPLDHDLRRNAGVIGAGLPEHIAPAHALKADQHVHQRHLKPVPHVQRAGDIGRRQHDAVGIARPGGGEISRALPVPVPPGLQGAGVVARLEAHFLGVMRCSRTSTPPCSSRSPRLCIGARAAASDARMT